MYRRNHNAFRKAQRVEKSYLSTSASTDLSKAIQVLLKHTPTGQSSQPSQPSQPSQASQAAKVLHQDLVDLANVEYGFPCP